MRLLALSVLVATVGLPRGSRSSPPADVGGAADAILALAEKQEDLAPTVC